MDDKKPQIELVALAFLLIGFVFGAACVVAAIQFGPTL